MGGLRITVCVFFCGYKYLWCLLVSVGNRPEHFHLPVGVKDILSGICSSWHTDLWDCPQLERVHGMWKLMCFQHFYYICIFTVPVSNHFPRLAENRQLGEMPCLGLQDSAWKSWHNMIWKNYGKIQVFPLPQASPSEPLTKGKMRMNFLDGRHLKFLDIGLQGWTLRKWTYSFTSWKRQ